MTIFEQTLAAGIEQAVDRAFRKPGDSISVYVADEVVYVRSPMDDESVCGPLPKTAKLHCVAQWWSSGLRADNTKYDTVQLRFDSARSEWRTR